jgi:hypothetical protein
MLYRYKTFPLLAILILFAAAVSLAGASHISRLGLTHEGTYTVLSIYGDGPARIAHQSVEAVEGKPFRIVVDCLAARHKLPQKEFTNLPNSIVTSVRTSQYSVRPEEIVRVVLDLTEESVYRVEAGGNVVRVLISDPETLSSLQWTSERPDEKPQNPTKTTGPEVKVTAVGEIPQEPDNQSITASADGKPVPIQYKYKTPPAKNKTTARKPSIIKRQETKKKTSETSAVPASEEFVKLPVSGNSVLYGPRSLEKAKPQPELRQKKPAQRETLASKDKPAGQKNPEKKEKQETQQREKPPPVVASALQPSDQVYGPILPRDFKPKEDQPAQTEAVAGKKKSSDSGRDIADQSAQKAKEFAVVDEGHNKPPVPGRIPGVKVKAVHKEASSKPSSVEKSVLEETGPEPDAAPDRSDKGKARLKGADAGKGPTATMAQVDQETAKTDRPPADKKTSRYRRSAAKSQRMKQTQVVQFPQRIVIKYNGVSRDPFKTLLGQSASGKGSISVDRIPNVETLSLVGVLKSVAGKSAALLEDIEGIGYILKPGDKVKNGYVAQITDDGIYFQINEYGWTRTMVKTLEEE